MSVSFVFGFLGHGFMFSQGIYSHDSMAVRTDGSEVILNGLTEIQHKISLGKYVEPLYRILTRGESTNTWLIGILSFIWIGLAVYLISCIFHIDSAILMVALSSILSLNITVTALMATYIHDADCDLFALLMSVLAVYLYDKYKNGYLYAVIPIVITLGIYQSYLSVALCLTGFVLVMRIRTGKSSGSVKDAENSLYSGRCLLVDIGKVAIMFGVGGGFYLLIGKIVRSVMSVGLSASQNSVSMLLSSRDWSDTIINTYADVFHTFEHPMASFPEILVRWINAGLFVILLCLYIGWGISYCNKWYHRLMWAGMAIGMPLIVNLANVFTGTHHLMIFAHFCYFIALILLLNASNRHVKISCVATALFLLLAINNIRASNDIYTRKKLEYDATLSLMTRIVARIELTPGYERGITPVAIVGNQTDHTIPGFERYDDITGLDRHYSTTGAPDTYQLYFDYVLNVDINISPDTFAYFYMDEVHQMPCWPDEDCIRFIGDTLVVRLGEDF